jgi:hypothetical protein
MNKNTYAGEKIAIIAEGEDTIMFLKHLCLVSKIGEPIYFYDFTIGREKGKDAIELAIETLIPNNKEGLECIGIVADAAEDRQIIHERLEEISQSQSSSYCKVSFLILPIEGNGGLETTLIRAIKPEHGNFKVCAQNFLQCVGNPHETKMEKHDKALFHLIDKAQSLTMLYSMIVSTSKPQLSLEDFMSPRGKKKNRSHYATDFFDFDHPAIALVAKYLESIVSNLENQELTH